MSAQESIVTPRPGLRLVTRDAEWIVRRVHLASAREVPGISSGRSPITVTFLAVSCSCITPCRVDVERVANIVLRATTALAEDWNAGRSVRIDRDSCLEALRRRDPDAYALLARFRVEVTPHASDERCFTVTLSEDNHCILMECRITDGSAWHVYTACDRLPRPTGPCGGTPFGIEIR